MNKLNIFLKMVPTYDVRGCRYFWSFNWQDRGRGSRPRGEEPQRLLGADPLGLELGPAVGHGPLGDVDPVDVGLSLSVLLLCPVLLLVHVIAHDCRLTAMRAGEDVGHLVHDRPLGDAHAPLTLLGNHQAHVKY